MKKFISALYGNPIASGIFNIEKVASDEDVSRFKGFRQQACRRYNAFLLSLTAYAGISLYLSFFTVNLTGSPLLIGLGVLLPLVLLSFALALHPSNVRDADVLTEATFEQMNEVMRYRTIPEVEQYLKPFQEGRLLRDFTQADFKVVQRYALRPRDLDQKAREFIYGGQRTQK